MDLETKNIDPVTKDFDPTISAQIWSPQDSYIYYRVEEATRLICTAILIVTKI